MLLSAVIMISILLMILLTVVAFIFLRPVEPRQIISDFPGDRIIFAAFGDHGTGNYRQWEVSRALNAIALDTLAEGRQLDFVALLGDNFYRYGVTDTDDLQWRYKFENMYGGEGLSAVPFFAVLGNHDYYGNEAAMQEYSREQLGSGRWYFPSRDYVRHYGRVTGESGTGSLLRVVYLETSWGVRKPDYTAMELESLLATTTPARWTIVATHEPLRSAGMFYGQEVADAYRRLLLPILQRHGVHAWLSGHHHNLQLLSYPDEPLYVISGAAGKYGDKISGRAGDALLFGSETQGFALVDVSAQQLVIEMIDKQSTVLYRHKIDHKQE